MVRPNTTEAMAQAAFLHDTLEDTAFTLEGLRSGFGDVVADIVNELTNYFTKEKFPDQNRAQRKHAEFVRLGKVSQEAKIIKMLDRIDNLRDEGSDPEFAKLYAKESAALAEVIGNADPDLKAELLELCEHVQQA
jgi:(p)ppGpp synthase/HD superfamily hydrolase